MLQHALGGQGGEVRSAVYRSAIKAAALTCAPLRAWSVLLSLSYCTLSRHMHVTVHFDESIITHFHYTSAVYVYQAVRRPWLE
jgi:hypothetical protein